VATVVLIIVLDVAQSMLNDGPDPHQLITGQTVFLGGHTAVAALMGNFMWMVAIAGWLFSLFGLAIVATVSTFRPRRSALDEQYPC
jgi:hypothetical protein